MKKLLSTELNRDLAIHHDCKLFDIVAITRLAIMSLFAITFLATTSTARVRSGESVFSESEEIRPKRGADPVVMRSRYAHIEFDQLLHKEPSRELGASLEQLHLNLFEDADFVAVLDEFKLNEEQGGFSWIGHIQQQEGSKVILVMLDDDMTASVNTIESTYSVRPAGSGRHVIEEVDTTRYLKESCAIHGESRDFVFDDTEFKPLDGESGCGIDLLVCYTPAAKAQAGGLNGIKSKIQLSVDETNDAFIDSKILAHINIVAMVEVEYVESDDIHDDLERLQDPNDGFIDNVHALRNSYNADLVSLIVDEGQDACGTGFYFCHFGPNNCDDAAFNVVRVFCLSPNYTLPHEIGHNLGCMHAPDDPNPAPGGAFSYSFGYRIPHTYNSWPWLRTIMVYKPGTRIARFSNPDSDILGITTGTQTQNNALTINYTRETVSNYR